jgi:AGCS family alanine or glycine:cation symporter
MSEWDSGLYSVLEYINNLVWGRWMLTLLVGTGIYLMIRLEGIPVRKLVIALMCCVGLDKRKYQSKNKSQGQSHSESQVKVSPLASLTTELAAAIGTGNIVGVASAMILGGPGALFWMVVSAFIGMATKLVESMLSVKYRTVNYAGEYVGGPMYTMKRGIKYRRLGSVLAVIFSIFAVCASFGMGNMTQANSIADSFRISFGIPAYKSGLVITIITILVVLGGIKSISKVTVVLVPVMGLLYVLAALAVIFTHLYNLPKGIACIVGMAFGSKAVLGGMAGSLTVGFTDALRWGISRGVFSNEAGLGAAGISAASADTDDYVRQGFISMTGVFFDTVVICSITGLAIACSGQLWSDGINIQAAAEGGNYSAMELVNAVFSSTFGEKGIYFTSASIALFAFATIAGWEYQGEKAFEYLFGCINRRFLNKRLKRKHSISPEKAAVCYRFAYALITYVGAVASLRAVWTFSDICNGLMAVPNLICVLLLSGEAVRDIKKYVKSQWNY